MNETDSSLPSSSLSGQATTAVRYVVSAFGGYLVGRGWISGDVMEIALAIVTTATPMAIGMVLTRINKKQIIEVKREVAALKSVQPDSAD